MLKARNKLHKINRNIEIYLKNKGLAGFSKTSYGDLAIEYGVRSSRIGQIVSRVDKDKIAPTYSESYL